MKKIILYNPQAVFFDMPLALLSIGSCLDTEKYQVEIIDARVDENSDNKLLELCVDALCFGVTALSGAPLKDALRVTRMIKEKFPNIAIIWGGWHPSLFPVEILEEETSIDISVYGQGEVTFKEIVDALDLKTDLKSVRGIAYRGSAGVVKTPARLMTDMDELNTVNYDLIDVEKYFKAKGKRQFDYISSTGCFFRCSFCADPFVFKRKWTAISPKRMIGELAHWHQKYGFTDVNFQDETFFTYKDRSVNIAKELIEANLNISWAATMRADQGARLDRSDFLLLKKSGLRRALIGVESGSQEMMDWLKKDIKIEQVLECADRCRDLGISAQFPFIVGFPEESDKSVLDSINFIKVLREMSPLFQTPIFYFKPYPGTAITENAAKKGYKLPVTLSAWSEFDFVDSKGGPWVSDEKYELIENFKFYSKIAWSKHHWVFIPLKKIAQWRCKKDFYKIPIERLLINKLRSRIELS
ncbi:MAG: radical SAM superfamily enzyme YgiQ (UPF0313 family) [Roseivirga sp.]|jgi:radical SAM superfamily enzyme YgiQ (UPF0313 family)